MLAYKIFYTMVTPVLSGFHTDEMGYLKINFPNEDVTILKH